MRSRSMAARAARSPRVRRTALATAAYRVTTASLIVLGATATTAPAALAQSATGSTAGLRTPMAEMAAPVAIAGTNARLREDVGAVHPGVSTLLWGGGGGVAGAFLGFTLSQVLVSDWDTHGGSRGQYVASGAAVGALGGVLLDLFGPPSRHRAEGRTLEPPVIAGRRSIETPEIVASGAPNVLQLIQAVRPNWLVKRGEHSISKDPRVLVDSETGQGYMVPADDPIIVYQDDMRLGTTDQLREMALTNITRIIFLDAREATLRFGAGHTHGAILLITALSARTDGGAS